MKKTFLFQLFVLFAFIGLSVFAQEKTILDASSFSKANLKNNASSNPVDATTLRWDSGVNDDAIGLSSGGTFEVSAMFPASLTGPLNGQGLTQVQIYINDLPSPCTLKIYGAGTATTPGTLLYSQDISASITALSWNTITLTTPVPITGTDIWVGYEVTHGASTYPAGCDAGPAVVNGDWIAIGGAWQRLYDATTGSINVNWNIAAIVEPVGPPCPVTAPTNPDPATGATGVSKSLSSLSWTNSAGTTQVEVFFGKVGNVVSVYSGASISSWTISTPLEYKTTYQWRVVDKNDTCGTSSPTWSFTTEWDPNSTEWCDDFTDLNNWTVVGPLGMTNWKISATNTAGGTAPELKMDWTPSFTGLSKIRSIALPLLNNTETYLSFNYYFRWYGNPSGTVIVGVTYDGGTTSTPIYTQVDATGNVGPQPMTAQFTTPATGASNAQIEISFDGNSLSAIWDIQWDNFCLTWVVPVELTSFTAIANDNNVTLNWSTATEMNNQGFEVQRKVGDGQFASIGYVQGNGTTTEKKDYSFTDADVEAGNYSYRLKQVDFNGNFEYSNVVEVEVLGIREFALEQNYPNPFNPSTKINFSLAVDSKVSLKVFDVLGQEVAILVNGQMSAGSQSVNFNASSLNSGVYFYRIDADGIDGQKFSSVKKMILTK